MGDINDWVTIDIVDNEANPFKYASIFKINGEVVTNANITTATTIRPHAFRGWSSLESVTIGNSVTTIEYDAFSDCSSLESVTIGNGVTTIGYGAFYDCEALESVTIGNSVTTIGYGAFERCSSLVEVNYMGDINDWVTIGFTSAFANPLYYATIFKINGEVVTSANITTATTISDYAFYNCAELVSVTIGDSVTTIGDRTFYNCTSLESVTIGNSVTTIGEDAFESSKTTRNVTLIIDSEYISNSITEEFIEKFKNYYYNSSSFRTNSVAYIYIKSGLSVTNSTYLLNRYTKEATSDKAGYDMYVRNA